MNVLLAEANVPCDQIRHLDEADAAFDTCDASLVDITTAVKEYVTT